MTSLASAPLAPHLLQSTATPQSYLDYNFPLPTQRYVGLLACQRDPLLTQLVTEVVKCDKRAPAPAASGGKAKKGKGAAAEAPAVDEYEIELLDTVLFPEGGGQPSDSGFLTLLSSDGTPLPDTAPIAVREVLRRNLDAVHYASAPIAPGTPVLVSIDAAGRTDKMCQHTGQHLLSAVIDRTLQLDTLSWSLAPAPQPCYLELARAPTPEEITDLQDQCNALIRAGTQIQVKMELGDGALGGKVPANYLDVQGGDRPPVMRTVNIVGVDNNPCCGTHYPSLSHLQAIHIFPQTSSVRGTNARLYFVVGPRVLSSLAAAHGQTRAASLTLGCNMDELAVRVEGLQSNLKDVTRREKALKAELASFVLEQIWAKAQATAVEGAPLTGVALREEDSTNALEFLLPIAGGLKERADAAGKAYLFALAVGSSPGNTAPSGALMILGTDELVVKAGKAVQGEFGARIKGGGKGKWQGKLVGKWEKGDEDRLAKVLQAGLA